MKKNENEKMKKFKKKFKKGLYAGCEKRLRIRDSLCGFFDLTMSLMREGREE